jgi:hypothetical protein
MAAFATTIHTWSDSCALFPPRRVICTKAQLSDHVWIVVAKAAIQASGLVMNTLLDQTLQLHDETYYWGGSERRMHPSSTCRIALGISERYTDCCTIQTPASHPNNYQEAPSITARWSRFYQIARQTAWNLGGHSIGANLLSMHPSSTCRIALGISERYTDCCTIQTPASHPNNRSHRAVEVVQITLRGGNSAQLSDHVWIVVAKAAIQASGLVMND